MGPHHLRKKLPPSPLHSTRLHPRDIAPNTLPLRFPTLATGVDVITIGEERLGERIWIGGSVHGVEVTRHFRFFALDSPELRPSLFTALRALDGSRSIAELASSLSIPLSDFSRLLTYLESEALIDFHSARVQATVKRTKETRREIERIHLPRGTSFKERSERTIAIISQEGAHTSATSDKDAISPIAISIAALLFGSGFTRIRFLRPEDSQYEANAPSEQISDRDLGLSIFNGRDIGMAKIDLLEELAHRSAILPREETSPLLSEDFNANLTISIGYPRPDHHQRWLSEDRTFFIVPGYAQGEVRIGPIVIPGRTPCLRCYELNQIENDFFREQTRQLRFLKPVIDPPTIATHLIAALAAHYATTWLDAHRDDDENTQGSSDDSLPSQAAHLLLGHQLVHDLHARDHNQDQLIDDEQARSPVRVERWHNHPECGCLWLPNFDGGINRASTRGHVHRQCRE
jgi:hypothetical protein